MGLMHLVMNQNFPKYVKSNSVPELLQSPELDVQTHDAAGSGR